MISKHSLVFFFLNNLCHATTMEIIKKETDGLICPYDSFGKLNQTGLELEKIGINALKEKKWGVVILSGGQGTRLGTEDPKGLYQISNKPLFEYHIDKIKNIMNLYDANIKLLVMTSTFTDEKVRSFFNSNNFGIEVDFFVQDNEICVDECGNPIMMGNENVVAPNGNGNIFKCIKNVNIDDLAGINVISVDNVLAQILDPVFVGAFIKYDYDILNKSVTKLHSESVGVFVRDGHIRIQEYSENSLESEGSQGNICNHLFKTEFVKKMYSVELPTHKAHKKIPYTKNGILQKPDRPNGYKREKFIFDCFVNSDNIGILNVPRDLEFAPLKNGVGSGKDDPKTCEEAIKRFNVTRATKV